MAVALMLKLSPGKLRTGARDVSAIADAADHAGQRAMAKVWAKYLKEQKFGYGFSKGLADEKSAGDGRGDATAFPGLSHGEINQKSAGNGSRNGEKD
jgi:hypothetical protein